VTYAQRRNRLTTHFSERIPVVKRHVCNRMRDVRFPPPCKWDVRSSEMLLSVYW